MRILHTADWHLGDRLGRIDRTDDLRRAVARVAKYCERHAVDVLLVAGDLFSELARPDVLREAIVHWQHVFQQFLHGGGTILTLTGNHDNETFCETLHCAMSLAAPLPTEAGATLPAGRLYLATEPTLLRIQSRADSYPVQFVLMPYPTPSRYLMGDGSQRYGSPEEKNQRLEAAFAEALRKLQRDARFDPQLPAVLGAHVNVRGAQVGPSLFRLSESEDVLVESGGLLDRFAYVALGHIHKPQCLGGLKHVRYSGSIERMDLGEKGDDKSVVLFEIGRSGLVGDPRLLPMESTPIYEIDVTCAADDIPRLREQYADAADDLVNVHLTYTAGRDNLEEVLRQLDAIFPRWYARDWKESGALGPSLAGTDGIAARTKSFQETVREFVDTELANHTDDERMSILERLEALLAEEEH